MIDLVAATSAAALGAVLFPLIIDSLLPSLGFEKTLQYALCSL